MKRWFQNALDRMFLDIPLTSFSMPHLELCQTDNLLYITKHSLDPLVLNIFNFLSRNPDPAVKRIFNRKFNSRVWTKYRFAVRQPYPHTSFSFIYSFYSPRSFYSSSHGGSKSEPSGTAPLEVFLILKYTHYFNKQHLRTKAGYEGCCPLQ